MPLIDFICSKCGKEFFEIINSSIEGITCPKCQSNAIKRAYKGRFYGKSGDGCSGDCGGCSGCH